MGDLLRRIFYPLVLPAIVVSVWANAWSMKVDRQSHLPLPAPLLPPALAKLRAPSEGPHSGQISAHSYGLSGDNTIASAGDEDAE